MKTGQLESISLAECCIISAGADKNAQTALYYIGYAIGFLVKCIALIFSAGNRPQAEAV